MEGQFKISALLRVVSVIFLILAIGTHPYSYFIFLRWVVSGTSFYTGWLYSQLKIQNWAWFFFIVGVLFNPIVPVYSSRGVWIIVDIIIATIFFYSLTVKVKSNSE